MRASEEETNYILVRAQTNSDWDDCDYTIIHLSEEWKKEMAKRLNYLKPLKGNYYFASRNFYDRGVDFYRRSKEDAPDIEALIAHNGWTYIDLDQGEQDSLLIPENNLDGYRLVMQGNGTAYYTAFGKYSQEEFWTDSFLITGLIK